MERIEAGWRVGDMAVGTPQDVRDGLGWRFRRRALRRSTGESARAEYWAASARLERERLDEMVVAGRRFRVVRAERFLRHGLSGPETPRPDDEDDAAAEGLLGPGEIPGSAALSGERWEVVPEGRMVPADVTRDARAALTTHPRVVLLAVRFAVVEDKDGHWVPLANATMPNPAEARRALETYFETVAPLTLELSREEQAAYHEAARLQHDRPADRVRVAGRAFRVVRVESAVRVGPDGPEPARPSDHDPHSPLTGETAELRTWDLVDDDRWPDS